MGPGRVIERTCVRSNGAVQFSQGGSFSVVHSEPAKATDTRPACGVIRTVTGNPEYATTCAVIVSYPARATETSNSPHTESNRNAPAPSAEYVQPFFEPLTIVSTAAATGACDGGASVTTPKTLTTIGVIRTSAETSS